MTLCHRTLEKTGDQSPGQWNFLVPQSLFATFERDFRCQRCEHIATNGSRRPIKRVRSARMSKTDEVVSAMNLF